MFDTVKAWLTPNRRKAIYVFAAAVGTLLVALGVVTPDMIDKGTDALGIVAGAVLALTNLLAALNVNPPTE